MIYAIVLYLQVSSSGLECMWASPYEILDCQENQIRLDRLEEQERFRREDETRRQLERNRRDDY